MNTDIALPVVLDTLTRATNQNPEIFKPAEEQLRNWETERGFYSVLMAAFSNHEIDVNVRWQAAIYFKNGVDRYWRRTAPNALCEEEKKILRTHLTANFNEPVNQIATQLAVIISKVARYDCPREWPELISILLNAVKSEQELIQHRALLTLHYVIKSLSSKRLAGDRRIFQELTSNILKFILNLWISYTDTFLQGGENSSANFDKSLLSLKVLRKLVVHGIKEPHRVEDAIIFLNSVFERLKTMLECRVMLQSNIQLREKCEKFIILLTKVLMDVLENHPFSYVQFIKPSLELTVQYLFTDEGKNKLFERFTINCLNLIKALIMCAEYRPAKAVGVAKEPATLEAHRIKQEFFTSPTLVEICRQLVSQYFLLTEDDLNAWENDPEGFAADEGGESWKFSLRPCTEVVFLTIFHEFRSILIPVLVEMLQSNVGPCDPTNLSMILFKDAIYNAVGLAAFDLFDEVDFDEWFTKILRKELEIKDSRYKVIRRRVIWLIGQWVGVKLATDLRPMLYNTILPLLAPEEDLIVRLAAAGALKVAVDDFEFNTDQFLPFLQPSFSLLFQVLQQVSEGDTKMHVLHVMSFLIERVGPAIQPHVDPLIQYLPLLWQESSEHNMLRCAILSTLVHLIQGLGAASEKLYPFLIPVIQLSTDTRQSPSVYLMEDGLELWLATMQNANRMHSSFLQLYPNILSLLDISTENLKTCFRILQAYVLLGPQEFLQVENFSNVVVSSCCNLVTETRPEGMIAILKLVEFVLQTLPSHGSQLFQPFLPFVFKTIIEGQEYPRLLSLYLAIISRVLIADANNFKVVLELYSRECGKLPEHCLGSLLDVWMEKMPLITQPERRKLCGLALTSLLAWPSTIITDRICGLLLAVVEVLNDIVNINVDSETQADSLIFLGIDPSLLTDSADVEIGTEHQRRKRLLLLKDPVHTIVLKDYLQIQLVQLQQRVGATEFQHLMQNVDYETMQQLKEYLKLS